VSAYKLDLILEEIQLRKEPVVTEDDLCFPPQLAFVKDEARFVDAICTRRAGKSNGLAFKYYRKARTHRNVMLPYFSLTRQSAKDIMWPVLQETAEQLKLNVDFTESNLTARIRNTGCTIKLFGADMKNFIRRVRGIKTPFAAIDEAQEFGPHLEELIDDILTPATSDYVDGQIALTGTPGRIPFGYFYDVTELRKYGYSHHAWSIYENPHMPNPRGFVDDLMRRKGWDTQNPTYLREWCGKWVKDLNSLVFKYDPEFNAYTDLPELPGEWQFVIGVDLGFKDADAIAVIGWNQHRSEAYLVDELVTRGQDISKLAGQIEKFIKKYDPVKVVMDTGGLGLKIAEEIRKRHSLPIVAAEKSRKFEFIEILNDAMRSKRFFARAKSQFAIDSDRVQWDTDSLRPDRLVVSDKFHSDICDAVLYAYREALAWLSEPLIVSPKPLSNEWYQREMEEMEAAAVRRLNSRDDDTPDFD
jgi:hypothetical protein